MMNIYDIVLSYLPSYLQEGDNTQKVYKVIAHIFEDIFQFIEEIKLYRDIDSAIGIGLDSIGSKIGEERKGRDDKAYRIALKARISINASYGDIESINDVARTFLKEYFKGIYETWYNPLYNYRQNALAINIDAGAPMDKIDIIDKARAGGIKMLWNVEFKNKKSDIYLGSCLLAGEEITVYPWQLKELTSSGKVNIAIGNNTGLDTTTIYPKKEVK